MTSCPKLHHVVEYCTPKWWQFSKYQIDIKSS